MCETLHPFEQAGLGQSPFRFVSMTKNIYSAAPGHQQPGGTCCYCGQGIMYECLIVSADGKRFTVGMDCVAKLDRADNRLVDAVHRAKLESDREKRNEERKSRWAEQDAKREAKFQEQRDRNGGLTDMEVREAAAKADRESLAKIAVEQNSWLIDVLNALDYRSDFIASMTESLERQPLSHLSAKCQNILRDVYAKHHGRRGSKKYVAAESAFDDKLEDSLATN
jgi:hypothetical protein